MDWRVHEENVARLRRRICKATREQDWASVRSLQKLMLGSWSNTLVSVRQVTQRNAGRRTNGRDRWGGCPVVRGESEHGGAGA
ncbi:reverse transcriptase N-terminal domain-containing protein [Mycobacterium marinum]|uniref:reverse transcriptase N-terminal domain-containing protein n=1 Tax=Mycobacterium marinum TaxID=1781 RepID=UPI001FB65E5C|nr:reverse transcriptase N-terminal domain-containing protein [Mycobacterium marinum]